ncbi:hypothetical protein M409DRAFT_30730 [Zasmidium cellare ATCC 36951]|uniref:non-specific serine/threonine protein kinase n=1 Tax=Zasmidium cellare ATCC 36951 TaxID=1080233 RepID=A0A6A6BYV5_ZASCE|nr:uncharacterized protein M409DRAFT_30730 [Zasmidium cellare ATCC 36951]KAF2158772.1 hypothetical protein M409DRAFT_30730 [Zasmidium cellare ATCC 36951]
MSETLHADVFIQKVQSKRIGGRYSLISKLGEGGFGAVYLGRDSNTGSDVALKLEHKSVAPSILQEESRKYEAFQGLKGFPREYWYGWHDDYKVMAFELLGPSLEDLLVFCGGRFSLKTTLLLVDQLLTRLETLHSKNVVHRDVKPQNFLLGCGRNGSVVHVTDFGLADEYIEGHNDTATGTPRRSCLTGTARFASIRGHEGRVQSPGDDLESLAYMMVYFMHGSLPWQGLRVHCMGEKEKAIMEKKITIPAEELCRGLNEVFVTFVKHVKSLQSATQPDYAMLREMFRSVAAKESVEYDDVFDWTVRVYNENGGGL